MAVIYGTGGSDTLVGTAESDTFHTSWGLDLVDGSGGSDTLVVDYSSYELIDPYGGAAVPDRTVYTIASNGGAFAGAVSLPFGGSRVTFTSIEHLQFALSGNDDEFVINAGALALGATVRVDGARGHDRLRADLSGLASFDLSVGSGPNSAAFTAINFEEFILNLTPGADRVTTGAGSDQLKGNGGDDVLDGGGGRDSVEGGAGNDRLYGGDGDDGLYVGTGFDAADGGTGFDTLFVDWSDWTGSIVTQAFALGASGHGGSYVQNGGGVERGAGFFAIDRFVITTGSGSDIIVTGAGDDIVDVGSGNDRADGGAGVDRISADLSGATSAVTYNLVTGVFTTPYAQTEDNFRNFEGLGRFRTGSGNDVVVTTSLIIDETIETGAGNDRITVRGGWDTVAGGEGSDTLIVDFSAATNSVTTSMPWFGSPAGTLETGYNGEISGDGYMRAVYSGIERFDITSNNGYAYITTGRGDDRIVTGSGMDRIAPGGGNDHVDAGAGEDHVEYGFNYGGEVGTVGVIVNLSAQAYVIQAGHALAGGTVASGQAIDGWGGRDTLIGFENASGGDLGDVFLGNSGINAFSGRGGDDRFVGGAAMDHIHGDDGIDLVDYSAEAGTRGVIVNLYGSGNYGGAFGGAYLTVPGQDWLAPGSAIDSFGDRDYLSSIERITTGGYADFVYGGTADNLISLGGGDDKGYGWDGNDLLVGADGNDELFGGFGDDQLEGGAGDDRLEGGANDDKLIGGGGVDTAVVGSDAIVVRTDLGWTATSSDGTDTLSGVEIVRTGESNILLVGAGGFATIQAAVDAAQDGDTILVEAGTYAENVTVDKDVTILGPNQGVDGTAARGAEAVIDGNVTISADGVIVDGFKFVGIGFDAANGQGAITVLADDFTLANSVFDALSGGGSAVSINEQVNGFEITRNHFQGYFFAIFVHYNAGGSIHDNRFLGGASGFGSNGTLEVFSSHVVIAENHFDSFDQAPVFFAPRGPDPADLESLVTGNIFTDIGMAQTIAIAPTDISPNIIGTDQGDWFNGAQSVGIFVSPNIAFGFDGRGGDDLASGAAMGDSLSGGAGDDELIGNGGNDLLDGGAGIDSMRGGTGDDVFVVDSVADLVIEAAGEGIDEIRTALASYSLASLPNVENLTAALASAHDFRGNSANNVISGGAGSDILRLQDGGNDRVEAGAGNDNIFFIGSLTAADVVNGGDGVDTLVIQGPYGSLALSANVTRIENVSILGGNNTSFGEPGTNRYDYVLTTNDANFAAGVQARINGAALLEGEDFTFDGSAETDAKYVVYGGKGRDTLTGGLGNDIFFYAEERFASGDVVNGGSGYDGMFLRGNYTIDFTAPGYAGLFTSIENLTLTSATDERYARGGGSEFDYNLILSDAIVKPGEQLTISGAILMASETMILDASQEADGLLRLFGGKANDTLKGGGQNDLLHGNLGADVLAGNGGSDAFRYQEVAESNSVSMDQILDFTPGTDKIELDRIDANTLVGGDQAFSWFGSNAFSGQAGQLRAYQQGGTWYVEGDVDGDSVADLVIALTLQGPTPLGAGDFLL